MEFFPFTGPNPLCRINYFTSGTELSHCEQHIAGINAHQLAKLCAFSKWVAEFWGNSDSCRFLRDCTPQRFRANAWDFTFPFSSLGSGGNQTRVAICNSMPLRQHHPANWETKHLQADLKSGKQRGHKTIPRWKYRRFTCWAVKGWKSLAMWFLFVFVHQITVPGTLPATATGPERHAACPPPFPRLQTPAHSCDLKDRTEKDRCEVRHLWKTSLFLLQPY